MSTSYGGMSANETLSIAYEAIKALCDERKARVIKLALEELRTHKMTPERAIHHWMELNTVDGFMKSLNVKLKVKPTEEIANG